MPRGSPGTELQMRVVSNHLWGNLLCTLSGRPRDGSVAEGCGRQWHRVVDAHDAASFPAQVEHAEGILRVTTAFLPPGAETWVLQVFRSSVQVSPV